MWLTLWGIMLQHISMESKTTRSEFLWCNNSITRCVTSTGKYFWRVVPLWQWMFQNNLHPHRMSLLHVLSIPCETVIQHQGSGNQDRGGCRGSSSWTIRSSDRRWRLMSVKIAVLAATFCAAPNTTTHHWNWNMIAAASCLMMRNLSPSLTESPPASFPSHERDKMSVEPEYVPSLFPYHVPDGGKSLKKVLGTQEEEISDSWGISVWEAAGERGVR